MQNCIFDTWRNNCHYRNYYKARLLQKFDSIYCLVENSSILIHKMYENKIEEKKNSELAVKKKRVTH